MTQDLPNFRILTLADIDWEAERAKAQAEFPTARYGEPRDASEQALREISEALAAFKEEAIQAALSRHPYAIQYAIPQSGHHGTWAFPKQMIKMSGADSSPGLIPDFLVASRSSLGYYWHIVELKRFDRQFANLNGTAFSPDGNQAVAQCNRYLRHFQEYIDAVRGTIRIQELVQPVGVILIIGDSDSETAAQQRMRADFVRTNPRINVVSYRRILQGLERDVASRKGRS